MGRRPARYGTSRSYRWVLSGKPCISTTGGPLPGVSSACKSYGPRDTGSVWLVTGSVMAVIPSGQLDDAPPAWASAGCWPGAAAGELVAAAGGLVTAAAVRRSSRQLAALDSRTATEMASVGRMAAM